MRLLRGIMCSVTVAVSLAFSLLGCASNTEGPTAEPTQNGADPATRTGGLYAGSPYLGELRNSVVYDEIWERPYLSKRDRSLITIAVLQALVRDELEIHIPRGLDNGLTPEEISEIILHVTFYAGWPTGVQASLIAAEAFDERGLVWDHPPIVAVNRHSGDPHYNPPAEGSGKVSSGDFLLIDLWARPKEPSSVYADITWTGFFGSTVPAPVREAFEITRQARDRGVEFLDSCLSTGLPVQGWEVDDQVRAVIERAGFGEFFVHRTGHNIGREVHGNGVNFDNIESHDTRTVIPGVLCSIEPGIYLENFGVRTEINVLAQDGGIEVTTPPQEHVLTFDV